MNTALETGKQEYKPQIINVGTYYKVESERSLGAFYITTLQSCSCKAFQYRAGKCKHIRAIEDTLQNERIKEAAKLRTQDTIKQGYLKEDSL